MYLDKIKIFNFRGIRKLKVSFEENNTVLIGENHWGKTSMLGALWCILGQGDKLCSFSESDIYVPVELEKTDIFPRENLVEMVTRRKEISFESQKNLSKTKVSSENEDSDDSDPMSSKEFIENISELFDNSEPEEEESPDSEDADVFKKTDRRIRIDLFFRESAVVSKNDLRECFKPYWIYDEDDGSYYIHWQIIAAYNEENDTFETGHFLLDRHNEKIERSAATDEAILTLIRLNPVFRFRDSRMESRFTQNPENTEKLKKLASFFYNKNGEISEDKISELIKMFSAYFDKYLANYAKADEHHNVGTSRNIDEIVKTPISLESLGSIRSMLMAPGLTRSKIAFSYISSFLFLAKGDRLIDDDAKPIMIVEDIESRFHPSLLLSFWSLLSKVDAQKIVTTNSGDFLSAVSLHSLRRLHRKSYDTKCYRIISGRNTLTSDDLRRIAFHVRMNRPMAFFARTWILVEGETEVWILTQIASILGISLACEGIRIIEFAQCGLKPLMKMASQLGIDFHVLTDGDDAGRKYAEIAATFFGKRGVARHLTVIPQKDIEHYLYTQGYSRIFVSAAGLSQGGFDKKGLTADKIINMAIKRKSKPGLALLLVDAIQKKGVSGIPVVFAKLLQAVLYLSQSCYHGR